MQRRRKAKPRLRKNCGQRSSCRSADSCVNLNKSYLSMYHNLFFLCEKHVHLEHVFNVFYLIGYFFNFRPCSCFLPFIFNAYTDQTQSINLSKARSFRTRFHLIGYFFNFRSCSCFLPFIFNAYTDQTLNLSIIRVPIFDHKFSNQMQTLNSFSMLIPTRRSIYPESIYLSMFLSLIHI